ncbi:hypothetical protein [Streptomyces mirabilis]
MPCFDAVYVAPAVLPRKAASDAVKTMEPQPEGSIGVGDGRQVVHDPGVVHRDVHAPEGLHGRLDAQVVDHGPDTPGVLDRLDDVLRPVPVRLRDQHFRALLGEGDCLAQASSLELT